MDASSAVDWSREALRVALMMGAPALAAALVVSLVVGAIQTLTQMHEPVIGMVPRLVAVALVTLALLPWMVSTWVSFATRLIGSLAGGG